MNVQKNTKQKSGGLFPQKSAALNWKKYAEHIFIHRGGSLFTAALLCTALLLFAQCANVKGIFTDNDSSATPDKEPDPACTDAPQSSGFNDGDGASEDTPYLICTYAQLGMMGDDLSAHYALGDNIDASASCGGDCSSPSGSGWTPVGDNSTDDDSSRFTGTLDGRDYMISDLRVNITEDYGGLFGYTGEHAEIRSVGLSGLNVMAGENSGGLVGYNNGSISNSYSTGTVSSTTGHTIGGLVGFNNGSISSSYSTATANSAINGVGGLMGFNNGSISNSYATGASSGQNNTGGLIGQNSNAGSISNSYAIGTAAATSIAPAETGGLVGLNGGGTISNSYATGMVSSASSSPTELGGLVGQDTSSGGISGINYFADDAGGSDGIGQGTCDVAVCVQAIGGNDTARAAWLRDSLDETDDDGLNWDAELDADGNAVWGNLNMSGFPCLKNMPAGAPSCD